MREVLEASASKTQNFRENVRNENSQTAAPMQLRFKSTHRRPFVTDANDTDEAIRTRPEFWSFREDNSQQMPMLPSFESSEDFVTRRRSAFINDGGNDDREHFVFPNPLSPVTESGTSLVVVDIESNKSTASENTVVDDKTSAELCGSPRQMRARKGKGIARDPTPTNNSQEPNFLPLLKDDSHFPKQPDHEEQTTKPRSNSLHSKLANLNKNLASPDTASEAPKQPARSREAERDQKVLRHLRLQTLIQSDQIKHLKVVTKDLAETLKQLQASTARDIQILEESSESQRENSDRLVGAWEGMRRELLELKSRMVQERFGQRVISRDEDGDRDRRGAVPDLSFSPPHSLIQPAPSQEYAFKDYPYQQSFLASRGSNPSPSTTVIAAMPGAVIASPSFSRTPSASHGFDHYSGYSSVPLQYWDHYRESHVLQNPQGCRWHYCSVCRDGGERVTGFE